MEKEKENKICRGCGKCCSSYWIFTDVPEEVERFKTLNTDRIEIIQIKEKLWKVMFNFPCKHLDVDMVIGRTLAKMLSKKDNGRYVTINYSCKIYDKIRPKYCPEYPRNFLKKDIEKEVLEHEKTFCPLLKQLTKVNSNSPNN